MDRATFDKIMRGEYDFQPHIIDKSKNIPQWKPITPIAQKTAPPKSAGLPVQQSLPYDRYGHQPIGSIASTQRKVEPRDADVSELAKKNRELSKQLFKDGKVDPVIQQELQKNTDALNLAQAAQNPLDAFARNLFNSASFGLAKRLSESTLVPEDHRNKAQLLWDTSSSSHPTAAAMGEGVGDIAKITVANDAISKVLGKSSTFSSLPKAVQNAATSGLTFGGIDALDAAGSGESAADIARAGTIGMVGGAAGSAASSIVGNLGTKALFKVGLQNSVPAEVFRLGTQGAAFSAGRTGATYWMRPEDERPTTEQMMKDAAVSFAFSAITGALDVAKLSRSNKAMLDDTLQKMDSGYAKVKEILNDPGISAAEKMRRIEYVQGLNDEVKSYIANNRFVGQDKAIREVFRKAQNFDAELTQMRGMAGGAISQPGGNVNATAGLSEAPKPHLPTPEELQANQARLAAQQENGLPYAPKPHLPTAEELASSVQQGYTVDNKVNWPGGPREGPLGGNTTKGGIADGGAGQQAVGADGGRGRYEGYHSPGTDAIGMEAVREDLGAGFNAVREGGTTRVETPKKGTAYEFREPREVDYTPRQNEIKQQAERDGMKVLFSDGPIKRTVNGRTIIFEEGGIYLGNGKILLVGDGDSYRHELGHAIEEYAPEQYSQYLDTIQSCFNMSSPEAVGYLQARIDDYRQFKPNFSTESIWRELANTIFNDPSAGDWQMLFSAWDAVVTATKQLEQDFRSYRGMQPLPANMMQQSKEVGGHREYTAKTSSKAERIQKRMERNFTEKMAHALSIPAQAKREQIAQTVSLMFKSLKENGKLTDREADMLFDVVYNNGVRVIDDYYNQYKPLKDELRMTRLQISDEDRADIPDFLQFRKAQFGKLNIVKANGIPIDSKYMELSERYPELFPEDITHPADQLQKIAEVVGGIQKTEISLDQYRGAEADMYKEFAKEEFDRAVDELSRQARQVKAYEDEQAEKYKPQNETPVTLDQAKEAYRSKKELSRKAERIVAGTLLTERDNVFVERLLKGEIAPNEIPAGTNKADILNVYNAKKAAKEVSGIVDRYKKQRREENRKLAEHLLENSDAWKEKGNGFAYERETMERNFRDIIPDAEEAERVVDAYITPIHKSEAQSTRMKNEYRERIRRLNLRTKNEYKIPVKLDSLTNSQAKLVDKIEPGLPVLLDVSESGLVQLYGEKKITEQQVRNCGANFDRISRAAQEFREIYNELLDRANDTLMENGYDPIERRKDYFPHFRDDGVDSLLGEIAAKLGMEIQKDELPTSISGVTDSFRPGKRWMPNALRRTGNATEYDALKGFDRYLEGASDIIYHTDNIQRLRALEDAIRYKYSDEGIKAEVDAVRENPTLSTEQKRSAIEEAYERSTTKFPYLVKELRTYTNILAGKKHPGDREVEHAIGRCIYNVVKSTESRVAANMIAANPGSALTNFIPLTQALGGVKAKNLLAGLKDTVKSYGTDDGYAAKSDFLTNRKGSDILSKTNLERVSDMASLPMQIIDDITSGAIARARYYENIENGMTEDAAITDSDKFTAGLMADRSKGATPTLFNRRNPVTKLFTMFQLETNNQLSYNLKDIPRDKKNKGALAIAAALTKAFIGAYLYNELCEKLTGRRAALDPIGIIEDAVGDFMDKDVKNSQAIANLGKNVAEEIPFVGGLIGGGRVPISSALPDITKIPKVFDSSVDGKKKAEILLKEGAKPAFYLLPPFGGGQLKKIVEGTGTVAAGGSYTYNNEGEKQLQFPVFDRSPLAYAQAATFGKYAIPTAQDYIGGGFRPLTAKQTDVYDTLTDDGADARRVYQTLLDLQQAEAVKDMRGNTYKSKAEVQREKLNGNIALTPSQKKYVDESLINDVMVIPQESDVDYSSNDTFAVSQLTEKQQERFEKVKASGVDADTYVEVINHVSELEGDKDVHGDTIPGSKKKKVSEYINSLSLTYAQRMALMEALGYKA